jgi:hypothetical protein
MTQDTSDRHVSGGGGGGSRFASRFPVSPTAESLCVSRSNTGGDIPMALRSASINGLRRLQAKPRDTRPPCCWLRRSIVYKPSLANKGNQYALDSSPAYKLIDDSGGGSGSLHCHSPAFPLSLSCDLVVEMVSPQADVPSVDAIACDHLAKSSRISIGQSPRFRSDAAYPDPTAIGSSLRA